MKKLAIGIVLLVLFISFCCGASAAGFTTNSDAIEKAADSVLLIAGPQASDSNMISQGSGFVAFNSSILITNYHVIDGVSSMLAWDDEDDNFEHGYEIKYVLCADKESDIAILEFAEPTRLQPLDLYPDDGLKRGAPVLAIGSPGGGAKNTVSSGIISSQYINSKGVPEIQTTAAISHGSSGGALFNDDGKVIGVTTATSAVEETQNINFAINIAVAKAMYNAWDGTRYTFANHKSVAKMDYTGVYDHQNQSGITAAFVTDVPAGPDSGTTESWTCLNCGHENTTKFCLECGAEKPYWICSCGRTNSSSKFCGDCGKSIAEQVESFNNAMKDASEHKYSEAITALESLSLFDSGSFETSEGAHAVAKEYIPKLYYDQGIYLQANNGSHEEIIESFEKAGDYSDAKEQIQGENAHYLKSFYDAGVEYLANGEYEVAVEAFTAAGDYQDAKDKIKEVYYSQGLDLLEKKEYEKSRDALRNAETYKDTSEVIKKSFYLEAIDLIEHKYYDKALDRLNNASGYSDSMEKIKEVYYLQAEEAIEAGDIDTAKDLFGMAGGYKDAKERIATLENEEKENIYHQAVIAMENGDYQRAEDLFSSLHDYRDAGELARKAQLSVMEQKYGIINSNPEMMSKDDEKSLKVMLSNLTRANQSVEEMLLEKKINYLLGQYFYNQKDFREAAQRYNKANDYLDAQEKCFQSKVLWIKSFIEQGNMADAITYYNANIDQIVAAGIVDQFVVIQPGSHGKVVNEILRLLMPAGIKTKISSEEDTYKEDYLPFIQRLEEHFGMAADGIITLEDYEALYRAIYSGMKSDRVHDLLEKLADLSYLGKLPAEHNIYEAKYINGVKKAEKSLGLQADGIVTQKEYEVIMSQEVEAPVAPAFLKIQVKNNSIVLSWAKVPGAVSYSVYSLGRFGSINSSSLIVTIEKEKQVLNIPSGNTMYYSVRANKYTVSGEMVINSVSIPRNYKKVSISDINLRFNELLKSSFVRLDSIKVVDWAVSIHGKSSTNKSDVIAAQKKDNYDLKLLCENNNKYVEIVIKNYKSWGWINDQDDPLGKIETLKTISGDYPKFCVNLQSRVE